jgi:alpha-L-fucosidase
MNAFQLKTMASALCAVACVAALVDRACAADKDPYIAAQLAGIDKVNAGGKWKADWDSLSKHEIPEWFKDAKFGIYAHWGVYSVPAHVNEWYPRRMYRPGDRGVFEHHRQTYGDQSKFGYKDFVPMFTAQKFDAQAWADLYEKAGAKFAGPVAEHHDGFSMWASKVNRWNVRDMGPKRDITGELVAALRQRDIKIIASFHHAFNIQGYYTPGEGWDTTDPQYADLYGRFKDRTLAHDRWLIKLKEAIDAYQPDQIWFDFGLRSIPDEYKRKMAAYYYNHESKWDKPVIITRKGNHLPEGVGALDIERGKMTGMGNALWQTDDSVATNSWCWVTGLNLKSPKELIHELIDIVSKRGVLLLNVCPKADGTIPDDQRKQLLAMGDWLKVNGEAIYATRPWIIHGEGPNLLDRGRGLGGHRQEQVQFTAEDIRYTRSKDGKRVYAIALGRPENQLTLTTVRVVAAGQKAKVTQLGSDERLTFSVNSKKQPVIQVPPLENSERPSDVAYSFCLDGFKLDVQPEARFQSVEILVLKPDRAELFGRSLRLDTKGNRPKITNWKDPTAHVHWLVNVFQAGTYRVRGEFGSMAPQAEKVVAEVDGQSLNFCVPDTGGPQKPVMVEMGRAEFSQPGVYHLELRVADPVTWNGVSVYNVQFVPIP